MSNQRLNVFRRNVVVGYVPRYDTEPQLAQTQTLPFFLPAFSHFAITGHMTPWNKMSVFAEAQKQFAKKRLVKKEVDSEGQSVEVAILNSVVYGVFF